MKKQLITCSLAVLLSFVAVPIYADDLMQVYEQALGSDPTFKEAHANWLSAQENLPIAKSGSGIAGNGIYPFINALGQVGRSYQRITSGPFAASGNFNNNTYQIQLTQQIFNYGTWKAISSARFGVKAATATYLAAAQDLMFRSAQAYFNVLNAYDQLQFTIAQKQSFLHQLVTTEQKFKVGLIAITGVYDAQASYDSAIAQEIQDQNNLENQLENLRAITGKSYQSLDGLKKTIPLVMPQPRNMEAWVKIADTQSYDIQSALNNMLADRESVKQTAALRYPTLQGQVTYGAPTVGSGPSIYGASPTVALGYPNTTTRTISGTLNLNLPVFQGGYVSPATKQQEYNYLAASDQLDFTHRTVVRNTRQAYLGVDAGISKIKADEQAIISSQNKLEATQAGYVVGTRTMVDVLEAVTSLYQAKQNWASDRYSYILSVIALKQQAGTLSPSDLAQINSWLGQPFPVNRHVSIQITKPVTSSLPMPSDSEAVPPTGGQPTRYFQGPNVQPLGVNKINKKTSTAIVQKKHEPASVNATEKPAPVKILPTPSNPPKKMPIPATSISPPEALSSTVNTGETSAISNDGLPEPNLTH